MAEQHGQGDWVSGVREGYAEVGDQRLHYVEAGDGPLVVLLHGFPEFWYGWRRQIQPLAAAGFRVVAPDTRGYNLSSRPKEVAAYDVDKLAADIRDLIHERGAETAMLVGHDWGGTIAWTMAMHHPEVVDRLAILNAAHPRKLSQGLHHPGQLRKSWYFFFFDLPELPETVVHANHWHFFRHFLSDARPAFTKEETDRYIEAWSQPGAATGMINYYRSSVRTPPKRAEAALRPVEAPTLVIWGERDQYLGPELAEPDHDDVPNLDRVRAAARRLALGAPRRGRARHATAHRVLRPGAASQELTMPQVYRTLRVAPTDNGVLSVVIDAPPMNLIGPELVRDLVRLLGALESEETRVMVLESADPEYFVPHVDLTKVAEYTAEAAKAGGPEGALPGAGGVQHLARLMGRGRAMEAILGSDDFGAELAERYGWINRALPDAELDEFVARLARRIASFPADAVRSAKRLLNELIMPGPDAIRADARRFRQLVVSDAAQGQAALFAQGLQTRGPLELDLGDRLGTL